MKPAYLSKTVIVNVLSVVVLILLSFQQSPLFANYGEYITGALAIVNLVLRTISKDEITWQVFYPTKS